MAKLPVDLRGVEPAGDFPIYPIGNYTLEVKKAEQAVSNNGNPKLMITLGILDGPDGSAEYEGKSVFKSYSLTEKSRAFLARFILACGMDPNEQIDDELLPGAKITAKLIHREYQGETRNDIVSEAPADAVATDAAPAPAGLQQP